MIYDEQKLPLSVIYIYILCVVPVIISHRLNNHCSASENISKRNYCTTQSRITGAVREPTFNYGVQLFLYVLHMLRVTMTSDLAHLIYREKESLYTERKGFFPYWNNLKKIVLRASICSFSSYFLFVGGSLNNMHKKTYLEGS